MARQRACCAIVYPSSLFSHTPPPKEHIANLEQSMYSTSTSSGKGRAQGAFAGPANPGHKEGYMAQNTLRVVEGGAVDKTKALDAALSQIERAFGKGSIMRLGKGGKPIEIESISTGS